MLMRRLAAVDLRRHDGVRHVLVGLAQVLVELDHVVRKLLSASSEHARYGCIAAEESSDMVRRAAHEAEGRFRPHLARQALRLQICVGLRDLKAAKDRISSRR
ncbi:hypothetical protein D3C87_1371310 [compost metagenome]